MVACRFRLALLAALVCALPVWSQVFRYPLPPLPESKEPIYKIYNLSEMGIPGADGDKIARAIPQIIEPGSWEHVPLFLESRALIVYQSPAVIRKVDEFLKNLQATLAADKKEPGKEQDRAVGAGEPASAPYQPATTPRETDSRFEEMPTPAKTQPPHLFHMSIRYEGNGIIDNNVVEFAKLLQGSSNQLFKDLSDRVAELAEKVERGGTPAVGTQSTPVVVAESVPSREPDSNVVYSRKRDFAIPFLPPQEDVVSLRLFVSSDQGQNWTLHATALPEQGRFVVKTYKDGSYWFTVQTIDKENRRYPSTLERASPSMKVVIDTQPPVVTLEAMPRKNQCEPTFTNRPCRRWLPQEIGVRWELHDDNLDDSLADSFHLEYRQVGSQRWTPLAVDGKANQHYWNDTGVDTEVRLRVGDRAGNWGEAIITLKSVSDE